MKRTITIITVTSIIVTGFFSSAYAMRGHHGYGNGFGYGMQDETPPCFDELTEEEFMEMQKERKRFLNDTRELRKEMFSKRMALETELTKEKPEAAKIKSIRSDIFTLKEALMLKRKEHREKMNDIVPGFKYHNMGMHNKKFRSNGGCGGFTMNP